MPDKLLELAHGDGKINLYDWIYFLQAIAPVAISGVCIWALIWGDVSREVASDIKFLLGGSTIATTQVLKRKP
ncbi:MULTISPECIES: hypothetical protein [unclassified Picosynechococcus]|uniref:hypothetical protein n=1 Tax=unclassified Picosynechococcus TaxID=3079910 RepID=UPI000810AA6F|nr:MULTISPECIES: hypothetical protein [unclassified Picosynechococcus]ANV86060.1 hypothetical protein AWQ22_00415 [Picosynechococcus sp. PCC 7117]ANV89235.1 hypothetical protein AWQ24_00430 [Picosynechococcus sp. PCC 8807]